jgi:hypothetical protein
MPTIVTTFIGLVLLFFSHCCTHIASLLCVLLWPPKCTNRHCDMYDHAIQSHIMFMSTSGTTLEWCCSISQILLTVCGSGFPRQQ